MPFESDFNEPKDRYFAAENLDFTSSDSPAVLDIEGTLGTHSIDGRILCKRYPGGGSGNILVELSSNGTTYGDQFTVFNLETFPLFGYKIKKIRITYSGHHAGYRVIAR